MSSPKDRFFALAFCWGDVLIELDDQRSISFASGATRPLLGWDAKELEGKSLLDLIAPRDQVLIDQILDQAKSRGRIAPMSVTLETKSGIAMPLHLSGHCLGGDAGNYFLAIRLQARNENKKNQEGRVPGSGLKTAKDFGKDAADKVIKARQEGKDVELTLLDIPGFEELTQRLGDDDKEHLLNTVGTCLRANSLDGDVAGQLDPNRFGLVHAKGLDIAKLRDQLAKAARSIDPEGKGADVEASTIDPVYQGLSDEDLTKGLVYAISHFETDGGKVGDLAENMDKMILSAVESLTNFRSMVQQDRFEIAFHPILDSKTGHCHHYEALVRFNGNFEESPFKMITFAEETGMISEFDIAMASKAVHWLAQRPGGKESLAVNVSGNSIGKPEYLNKLMHLLDQNRWTQGRLLFEITESARMADLESANVFIQGLRDKGYPVCLDDFGAGAASFQYLSMLDVDVVKLDGSAVQNAQKAPKGTAFLMGLVAFCNKLGVETIAEMVDSPQGLEFVRKCGVQYVQGFLFGKPAPDTGTYKKNLPPDLFGPPPKPGLRRI